MAIQIAGTHSKAIHGQISPMDHDVAYPAFWTASMTTASVIADGKAIASDSSITALWNSSLALIQESWANTKAMKKGTGKSAITVRIAPCGNDLTRMFETMTLPTDSATAQTNLR